METNTNKNAWPVRIELRSEDSVYAAELAADVNRENGDAVGWRVLSGRWIEVDSIDDADDLGDYIHREAELLELGDSDRYIDTASPDRAIAMHRDASSIFRAAARNARGDA